MAQGYLPYGVSAEDKSEEQRWSTTAGSGESEPDPTNGAGEPAVGS